MAKTKAKSISEGEALIQAIVAGMEEKKAHEIVVMDLRNLKSAPADYFVICHGDSTKQADAIAQSVDETVKKVIGENPWHAEGAANAEWVLLDYINVVVHVFQKEKRGFYGIEDLWADAVTTHINEL